MVSRFQAKPSDIQAVQFTRTSWNELRDFAGKKVFRFVVPSCKNEQASCLIATPGGNLKATEGDWIVKNIDGSFSLYGLKLFPKLYDKLNG